MFTRIVKRLTHLPKNVFREKPPVAVDDFVLEHFLLYHGLVGTSPDKDRDYDDVQSDIFLAVESNSKSALAVALKLPPLWWKDRLNSIFSQLEHSARQNALGLLLSQDDTSKPPKANLDKTNLDKANPDNADLLNHEDWQVRANAAYLLAHFDIKEATPHIVRALHDTASNGTSDFCHLAYSLGQLQTMEAREALISYLYREEPWFRVDAAGSLAMCPYEFVALPLMQSMQSCHNLNDYMSVAIGRRYRPIEFLSDNRSTVQDGACELIIGIIEASQQTFDIAVPIETGIYSCLDPLAKLTREHPSPVRIRACQKLADWMLANLSQISEALVGKELEPSQTLPSKQDLQLLVNEMHSSSIEKLLTEYISKTVSEPLDSQAKLRELQHVVELLGEFSVCDSVPCLISLLKLQPPVLDTVIDALGKLKDISAVPPLLDLARSLVDLEDRAGYPKSKQPVAEQAPGKAKTYWTILKALGCLPTIDSLAFLLQATEDYAPDKRQQALSSLVSAYVQKGDHLKRSEIVEAIRRGLNDPATPVRLAALAGIESVGAVELIEPVLQLVGAKEVSLRKQALMSLAHLRTSGHASLVEKAVQKRLGTEKDQFKRDRLRKLFDYNSARS